MREKITREEEREAYEQYLNTLNAMAQKEIDGLRTQLALSTERENTYRKALERIVKVGRYVPDSYSVMRNLAYDAVYPEKALSSSPAPEPVTVEE